MEYNNFILNSENQFETIIKNNDFVLIYFSHEKCNVCKVLKPKIKVLLQENYPKATMLYVDTEKFPAIAGQNSVFAVPTIITFAQNKELFRRSRNIGLAELEDSIKRPYDMIFDLS